MGPISFIIIFIIIIIIFIYLFIGLRGLAGLRKMEPKVPALFTFGHTGNAFTRTTQPRWAGNGLGSTNLLPCLCVYSIIFILLLWIAIKTRGIFNYEIN